MGGRTEALGDEERERLEQNRRARSVIVCARRGQKRQPETSDWSQRVTHMFVESWCAPTMTIDSTGFLPFFSSAASLLLSRGIVTMMLFWPHGCGLRSVAPTSVPTHNSRTSTLTDGCSLTIVLSRPSSHSWLSRPWLDR